MKILIIYELENREYDNAQLLAAELVRRGHTAIIESKATCLKFRKNIDILIIPNCYTTDNYELYTYMTNAKDIPVFNLQYEQVLSQAGEKRGYHNPKGKARQAIHLCWGEASYNRLLSSGVEADHLRITGAVQLDFLREGFAEYYIPRDAIAKTHGIENCKQWLLYISSFTMAADNARPSVGSGIHDVNALKFIKLSQSSRRKTFKWFERILNESSDIIIIYRIHPAEREDQFLKAFQDRFIGQFYLVDSYSVKQWISVSDLVCTWFSTSIVESYFAKKMCYILRPVKIPEEIDSVIFKNSSVIESVEEFQTLVKKDKNEFSVAEFPISSELINAYYDYHPDKQAFVRVADEIEAYGFDKSGEHGRTDQERFAMNRYKFLFTKPFAAKSGLEDLYIALYKRFKVRLRKISPIKARYLGVLEKRCDSSVEKQASRAQNYDKLRSIINATNSKP